MSKADIGLIGLGVMGENVALNMVNNGFCVEVYNGNSDVGKSFVGGRGKDRSLFTIYSLEWL